VREVEACAAPTSRIMPESAVCSPTAVMLTRRLPLPATVPAITVAPGPFDTAFDSKGTVGLFLDVRPAGLRWSFPHQLALVFDPLSLAIVAPVLGDPGILQLEYRTLLGVEMVLPWTSSAR